MKKPITPLQLCSGSVMLLGLVFSFISRAWATKEAAGTTETLLFALSMIAFLAGGALFAASLRHRKPISVRALTLAAMFAALCYIGFAFLRIDIPVGSEKTAFHLGNVFCVLAALFLGGLLGGMSGAIGLTIADLTSSYVTSAPKTFFMKLGIGLVAGFVAHRLFSLSREKQRKVSLPVATVLSCGAGMVFNMIVDPVVGYFYKTWILGIPQDAAAIWVKLGAAATAVNAVVAVIAAAVLYLALRPALKRSGLMPQL